MTTLLHLACMTAADEGRSSRVVALAGPETLRLESGELVRLAGVHVPPDQALAAEQALQAELDHGSPVPPSASGGPFDRYGRRLVLGQADGGPDLAALLVGRGLALVRPEAGIDRSFRRLLMLEERARRGGLGLWGGATSPLAQARSADALLGRY
ncbi:MAG: hypothetical protein R3349_05865, partial [Geminicoccaceae bacterium]|nr:hypothetical protein [Geminicoccaceae bacterium]